MNKSKLVTYILGFAGLTLVGGETVERRHLQEPAKHIDNQTRRPVDPGRFQYVTQVTTTDYSSGKIFVKTKSRKKGSGVFSRFSYLGNRACVTRNLFQKSFAVRQFQDFTAQ